MTRTSALLALFLGLATLVSGQDPARPAAKIADVAWLQGYWEGQGLGGTVEDVWLPPRAGVMIGAFRQMKADGTVGFYEIFAIEELEGSLRIVVKHFHPDWVGWEEKDKSLSIRLTRIAPGEAVFGGIAFTRVNDDEMTVALTIRSKDAPPRQELMRYKRRPL